MRSRTLWLALLLFILLYTTVTREATSTTRRLPYHSLGFLLSPRFPMERAVVCLWASCLFWHISL